MNIPKAIELLSVIIPPAHSPEEAEFIGAVQLGIEALKEIQRNRPLFSFANIHLLPGETKE